MSESIEEYLEAIYAFNEMGELAKNQDLAQKLKVAPPSITQMIKKLADDGFVTYEPYKGAMLTGKGMAKAQKVVRKHRILERFLHDTLGLGKEKIHDEACRLEHSISDEATAALCEVLNKPVTCPDDNKNIPPCTMEAYDCSQCKELRVKGDKAALLTQLSSLKHKDSAKICFIRAGKNATQRILDMGLCPGTTIKIMNSAPFHGPLEVNVRGTNLAIGRELAEKIFVEVKDNDFLKTHPHGPHHAILN